MKPIHRLERAYRASKQWIELRKLVYSARGHKCEKCESTNKLHVHHKTYENFGNESLDDLELLCSTCHRKRHSEEKMLDEQRARKLKFRKHGFARFHGRT